MTTEVKPRLSDKREAFCVFYDVLKNATKAAEKAGYSLRTAYSIGCELLTKPEIRERLAELAANRPPDPDVADVQERKQTLSKVVRSTYADFTDERGNLDISDREKLRTPAIQELKSTDIMGVRSTTLKLRDPIAAIAELNKMERVGAVDTQPVSQDNRVLIINVNSDNAKSLIDRLAGRLNATE